MSVTELHPERCARSGPHPAQRRRRGAVRARRHAAEQGRHRRCRRGPARGRLLPPGAPGHLLHDPRPVRPRRAGRRRHRGRRPDAHRGHRPRGRRPLPAHARLDGADGRQRRLLRPHRPRAGDPAPPRRGRHPHRHDGLHRHRRRRPDGRPRAGRGVRRHRSAHQRGLRAAVGHHGRRAQRDRGDLQPRRRDGRRADGIHRARQAHQRTASRAAHHRRGAARDRQVDPRGRHRARCVDQARTWPA